jgi:hypothetical protein
MNKGVGEEENTNKHRQTQTGGEKGFYKTVRVCP